MSKEAMRLALEALEIRCGTNAEERGPSGAITALREALAAQPAQQEPVLQDIEQYRLQMAGICTAAIGYWKEVDGIHADYDTIALRDVAKLYAKYDELYRAQRAPASQDAIFAARRSGPYDVGDAPEPWAYAQGWKDAEKHHNIKEHTFWR